MASIMIIPAMLLGLFIPTAFGEVPFVPIAERTVSADVVAVAKIINIKKRAAHVTAVIDGQELTRYFDIGTLKLTRVLKAPTRFAEVKVQVAFQSGRLPGEYEGFPDYGIYYKDGDEGVWLLRWSESLPGKYLAGYDLEPLVPLSAEKEVLAALKPKEEKK
jgi:hypothetical protein